MVDIPILRASVFYKLISDGKELLEFWILLSLMNFFELSFNVVTLLRMGFEIVNNFAHHLFD